MADTVTLDDIQGDSSRRRWLRVLAAGGGLSGLLWFLYGDVDARPLAVSVALTPDIRAFDVTADTLTATIHGDTDADEWVFRHEYQELDEAITAGEVPTLGGEVSVSLAQIDRDAYPTDRFQFQLVSIAESDTDGGVDIIREGAIEFSLPKKAATGSD